MATDTSDRDIDVGLANVHIELARYGIIIDLSAPGYPDAIDDMTTRAVKLLKTASRQHVIIAEDTEPLDDEWEHDGKPPVGDLVTEAPNPT